MQLYTITEQYVEVIVNGQLVKADIELIGNRKAFTIASGTYFI